MNHRPFRRDLSALSLALLMVLAQTSFSRPVPDFDQARQTPQQPRPFPPTSMWQRPSRWRASVRTGP